MINGLDGINVHNISDKYIKYIKALGVSYARIDINWYDVEPTLGVYNWRAIDDSINSLRSAGINIYATISYVPLWINSSRYGLPNKDYWEEFCKKVADRYKNKIFIYSLWNEPNLKTYSDFYNSPKKYIDNILIPGSRAISSIGPYLIAAGDLSMLGSSSWTSWINYLSKYQEYYDILSIHCYDSPIWKMKMRYNLGKVPIIGWIIPRWRPYNWYLKMIKKPIYLTECGYKASNSDDKELNNQVKYYKELLELKSKFNFKYIYAYHDHDYPNDEPWGLYTKDWKPKKIVES